MWAIRSKTSKRKCVPLARSRVSHEPRQSIPTNDVCWGRQDTHREGARDSEWVGGWVSEWVSPWRKGDRAREGKEGEVIVYEVHVLLCLRLCFCLWVSSLMSYWCQFDAEGRKWRGPDDNWDTVGKSLLQLLQHKCHPHLASFLAQ